MVQELQLNENALFKMELYNVYTKGGLYNIQSISSGLWYSVQSCTPIILYTVCTVQSNI